LALGLWKFGRVSPSREMTSTHVSPLGRDRAYVAAAVDWVRSLTVSRQRSSFESGHADRGSRSVAGRYTGISKGMELK